MKTTLKTITSITLAVLVSVSITQAIGSLTPSGTAGDDTQYSLNDIYNKLSDFTDTPTATSSPFTVPGTASATFNTLSEIYNLLTAEDDDLVAANIADGVEIFGVEGTLVEGFPDLEWSNYAEYEICWDSESGCIEGFGGLLNGEGSVEYCENLNENGYTDWRLPTNADFFSITDYTIYAPATSLAPLFASFYWTSTEVAEDPLSAWIYESNSGIFSSRVKSDGGVVSTICTRTI